jgi:transcriptional regulator with XRE-family HTH domain
VPTGSRSTLRAQWLGQRLRELRDANGMTLARAADFLQRNASTVSRFESGEYPIRRPDLMALLDLYGVCDRRQREGLLRLSEEVWQKGWWNDYEELEQPFGDFIWLESRATEIRVYETTVIPGLLQTQSYAFAVITTIDQGAGSEQILRWVQVRMDRQAVLQQKRPPRLTAIIDESAMRRVTGGPATMADQLSHLLACAELPHVDIRVLPANLQVPLSPGGFTIYTIAEPDLDIGVADSLGGAVYVEPPDSARFVQVYDRLLDSALGPAESAKLIRAIGERIRQ